MRKFKIFLFSVFCFALVAMFSIEVFAATYLTVNISGNISFMATDIGGSVWGAYSTTAGGTSYLNIAGASNYVCTVTGTESSYSGINATMPNLSFDYATDTISVYVFIKNVGSRFIMPQVTVNCSDTTNIVSSTETMFFDISAGHIDPLNLKGSSGSASSYITSINGEINGGRVSAFSSNASIDNRDTYLCRITFSVVDGFANGIDTINAAVSISIAFMADVQYTSNNILSVWQDVEDDSLNGNSSFVNWNKFGYNATLTAKATKVSTSSLDTLAGYLRNADAKGNANITYGDGGTYADVYSESTVVYKDIDIVNVDISTGEIIGKLSDLNYNFEWYGRSVTLPAGTRLASGRLLTNQQTFTVDVYTYYPTMYIRRWQVGTKQWISVSDTDFAGAVCIPEHYTATFTATTYNPDKTVATSSTGGIIPRSYICDNAVLLNGKNSHLITYYGYSSVSGITNTVNQPQALSWATNLTKAWASVSLGSGVKRAILAQGQNYTRFVYNLLYLVKYANNNSQKVVGYGNINTYPKYNGANYTITSTDGSTTVSTQNSSQRSYYESIKSGGTITTGGTANTGYFNAAGLAYGYDYNYTYGNHKTGLYAPQFLTYNNGTKRILCDGSVGSDSYTSVFCLGQADTWGSMWTWIYGAVVLSDGTDTYAYFQYDNYNYSAANYMMTNSSGFESNRTKVLNAGYQELSYTLPASSTFFNATGVSRVTNDAKPSLIAMPTSTSAKASDSTGLCDNYYANAASEGSVYCICIGGHSAYGNGAGIAFFYVANTITGGGTSMGFRAMLV